MIMKKISYFLLLFLFCPYSSVFSEIPETPDIISLVATGSSITVAFKANSDQITDGYYITYWKTSESNAWTKSRFPNPASTSATYSYLIRGLDNNTQYTVRLTAYDGEDESAPTVETVETSSVTIHAKLIDIGTVRVSLDEVPSGVEYFAVYIGSSPGISDILDGVEVKYDEHVVKDGLPNGVCYVRAILKDGNRVPIAQSEEKALTVEGFGTLLSDNDVDDGCFIESSNINWQSSYAVFFCVVFSVVACLITSLRKRVIPAFLLFVVLSSLPAYAESEKEVKQLDILGLRAGYFVPSEKIQRKTYDSIVPVSLFYERRLNSWLSGDVSAGYSYSKGYAVTKSYEQTGVRTKLDFIPLSVSAIANWDYDRLITFYAGAGLDYWLFREKTLSSENKSDVSGWHGKAGVKLLTGDPDYYARFGVILEVCYSVIDRFGKNSSDLGGITYNIGLLYLF